MAKQENDSVIVDTGSKQGITCPPRVPLRAGSVGQGSK